MKMAQSQKDLSFSLEDALYCGEEHWEADDEVREENSLEESYFSSVNNNSYGKIGNIINNNHNGPNPDFPLLFEEDLYWEYDELSALLSKELESPILKLVQSDPDLALARVEAVGWMLKVHSHYSFSALTALLAVNYFDRFIFSCEFHREIQWMTQLAAVACLSLAAKVEETRVPLLLDFQVEDSKYVFEAKTIQRMEILVLSTLEWKMNPVTPHSFLDYLTRRFRFNDYLCREFLRRCERVLLSAILDSRFMPYRPSLVATATILHVANGLEPSIGDEYQNQLLVILGIDKEIFEECCQLIRELEARGSILQSNKRKSVSIPGSPNGVIDVSFSSDDSNDSWAVTSSVPSSPDHLCKKIKIAEDRHLERFSHPSVDFLSISR